MLLRNVIKHHSLLNASSVTDAPALGGKGKGMGRVKPFKVFQTVTCRGLRKTLPLLCLSEVCWIAMKKKPFFEYNFRQ